MDSKLLSLNLRKFLKHICFYAVVYIFAGNLEIW